MLLLLLAGARAGTISPIQPLISSRVIGLFEPMMRRRGLEEATTRRAGLLEFTTIRKGKA